MPFFTRPHKTDVQTFILKLVNNNCPELRAACDGPRGDSRVNLSVALMVVPLEDGCLAMDRAFPAVTREFSVTGLSIILAEPKGLDEMVLGLRMGEERAFVRAQAKHLSPMGCGFFYLGCELIEVLHLSDWPELSELLL